MIVSRDGTTGTVLDQILARTAADLPQRKAAVPLDVLEHAAERRTLVPSLRDALAGNELSLIAEVKRASPSKGVFAVDVEPMKVATEYLEGGAAAISCLTDEPYFHGSLADLRAVAEVAHAHEPAVPVLRKDFVIDPYQIIEAKAYGADAILLITAALANDEMRDLREYAESIGMQVLVEVHDENELARAVSGGATIVGINNRDLKTLAVDVAVTERLAPLVPDGTVVVGESGIFTPDDAMRMARAGAHAILVGEALILQSDRAAAARRLLGAG